MNYNNIISLVEKHKNLIDIANNLKEDELILTNKSFYIEANSYQTLYNYIVHKSEIMLEPNINRTYKIFFSDIIGTFLAYGRVSKTFFYNLRN